MFRISDQGDGVPESDSIFSFSRYSSKMDFPPYSGKVTEIDSINFGLILSKVYANYWNGDVSMVSMDGYGADIYLTVSVENLSENLKCE